MTGAELEHVRATAELRRAEYDYACELAKAKSPMLPSAFRGSPGDLLLVMEYGKSLNLPIAQIFTDVHLVNGKPGMSAKLMHALMLRAGHKVRVSTARDGRSATCRIIRTDDPEPFEETFTLTDAVQAGLCEIKQGKVWARDKQGQPTPWERYTRTMLRNRAISAAARAHCPDVLAGVSYTPDELEDVEGAAIIVDGYTGTVVDADETPVDAAEDAKSIAEENEARWRTEWLDRLAEAVRLRDLPGLAELGKEAAAHGHADLIDTAKAAWRRVRDGARPAEPAPAGQDDDETGGASMDDDIVDAEVVEDGGDPE